MSALVEILANFQGGLQYGHEIIEAQKQLAPLKAATDMGDCADAFVMLAKNGIQYSCILLTMEREYYWLRVDSR